MTEALVEAPEETPAPVPLLRGVIKVVGEELSWSGKWAFGKEGHAEKKTNKFALTAPMSSTTGVSAEGKIEAETTITFNGFFKLTKTEGGGEDAEGDGDEEKKVVKIKEENVKITFRSQEGKTGYDISGTGKNKFGDFTLVGSYSSDKNQMWGKKEYEDEEFDDDSEDSGSDEDGDGIDEADEDIAAELADLREDAAYHGLDGAPPETKARRKDGGGGGGGGGGGSKKIVKRKAEDAVEVAAGEAKKPKMPEKLPEVEWGMDALKASKARLQVMVDSGEVGGTLMVLDELAHGGKVTVPLLQETQVGRDVKNLKKHADPAVAAKASAIVDMWKAMVR